MILDGEAARLMIRAGAWRGPTAGLAPGFVQANLVVLPAGSAGDFRLFCERNPRPCPLLDVTAAGCPVPDPSLAANADLRTDLPRYRVYRDGRLAEEVEDLLDAWRPDFVAFLLGCSFTFEGALVAAGIPVRHLECGSNVPMYRTTVACRPAGALAGPLVVSMRPIPRRLVAQAVAITARFPHAHGAPVHAGDPAAIGVGGRPQDIEVLRGLDTLQVDQRVEADHEELASGSLQIVEVMLSPYTTLAGKTLAEVHFREKYGVSVLAIWRGNRGRPVAPQRISRYNAGTQLGSVRSTLPTSHPHPSYRAEQIHSAARRTVMAESVYKIVELVGTSDKSWEKAAKAAVEIAAQSLRDLRIAEVVALDMQIEEGKVHLFRAKVKLSFKFEASE